MEILQNVYSLVLIYEQLFLNGVSYCEMFPPSNNSVNVSGLAGGRLYEVMVEVYSTNPQHTPQMSNKLVCIVTVTLLIANVFFFLKKKPHIFFYWCFKCK